MNSAAMPQSAGQSTPLTVFLAKWWGYIISAMYWLYGGVKMVLSILDRQYGDMGQPVIFLVIGVLMLLVTFAFRDRRQWGWYGLLALNGAVVILALFGLSKIENIVLLALSILALAALLAPSTKAFVTSRG